MPQGLIPRSLEPVSNNAVDESPCVSLVGPRQPGRTTLLKRRFGERFRQRC